MESNGYLPTRSKTDLFPREVKRIITKDLPHFKRKNVKNDVLCQENKKQFEKKLKKKLTNLRLEPATFATHRRKKKKKEEKEEKRRKSLGLEPRQ